jgi:hypothetical protein
MVCACWPPPAAIVKVPPPVALSPGLVLRAAVTVNDVAPAGTAAVVLTVSVEVRAVPAGVNHPHETELGENEAVAPAGRPLTERFAVTGKKLPLVTVTRNVVEPAVPAVGVPDCAPTASVETRGAADAGVETALTATTTPSATAKAAKRRRRGARGIEESEFFMVVPSYGQLLVAGSGSIRMYVIGPVMFTPHEVIWYSAWLCEMM